MRRRSSGVTTGDGASSTTFWWRRWSEHSRSPSETTLPCWSPSTWISTWRGSIDVLLEVDRVVAEARRGLGARGAVGARRARPRGVDHAHPLAAAAGRGLEHHRIADLRGRGRGRLEVGQRVAAAGHHRHAGVDHQAAALDLRAHRGDRLGRRADEGDAGVAAERARSRRSRRGSRSRGGWRRRRSRPRARRCASPSQIALARRRRADAVRLVGEQHGQAQAVGVGVDDRAADPQLAQARSTRTAISPRLAIRTLRNLRRGGSDMRAGCYQRRTSHAGATASGSLPRCHPLAMPLDAHEEQLLEQSLGQRRRKTPPASTVTTAARTPSNGGSVAKMPTKAGS